MGTDTLKKPTYSVHLAEVSYWSDGISGAMPQETLGTFDSEKKARAFAKKQRYPFFDVDKDCEYRGEPYDAVIIYENEVD